MKKILFTLLFGFLLFNQLKASSYPGGQVTYRYLNGSKFEIKYKIYRDCRGTPITFSEYTIQCSSTSSTKKLNATRVGIEDITAICKSASQPCNPSNTYGTGTGFEEHTYMDTLDFNGAESAFKNCCIIQIGIGKCCRYSSITTGGSGNDFWVFSTLDLCKAPTNSSPVFTFKPTLMEQANVTLMKSFLAKDSIDGDSLSYHFADPLQSWTSKTSWSGGLDSKNPFTAYYPNGYNKANGPRPDLNPPYGIYLDPQTGNLIGMPIDANQATILAVAVKEWRKDNNGKYNQIGEIVIDQMINFITSQNHQPSISEPINHKVCEGQTFILNIATDDQPFTLPPPASSIKNDTVSLSWDQSIKNAKYSVSYSNVKLPTGKFEWTPATGDSKKSPFFVTAIATDNNCPRRGTIIKTFKITVYPKINVSSSVKKINPSTYTASINISNKKYSYVSGKFINSAMQEDIRNFYFKSSKSVYSTSEIDTIVFKKNGTYILNQSFLSQTDCNSITLSDTIIISNILEVTFGIDPLGKLYTDTSVCMNQTARMVAKVTNAKRPVTYVWKTKSKSITDTLGYFDHIFSSADSLFVSVKDANNQSNNTFRLVNVLELPDIDAGFDQIICPETSIKLKAKNKKSGSTNWQWTFNKAIISNADSVMANAEGLYKVAGTNTFLCTVTDSLKISHLKPINLELISGIYCQNEDQIDQAKIIKNDNPNKYFDKITWKLLKSLPKPTGGNNALGDVLMDKDASMVFDFAISFGANKIAIASYRDSLILSAIALDTNGCRSLDTNVITILKMPVISISKSNPSQCINQTIELDSIGKSNSTYRWIPLARTGFGSWPSYAPLSSTLIAANYFKIEGNYKLKLEAFNNQCVSNDSAVLNVFPLPKISVSLFKYPSSIKFRDETVNVNKRNWYINNVHYSSEDTLLLSKSFAHLQPIKLEVFDNNGCSNDTVMIINTMIAVEKIEVSLIEVYPNPAQNTLTLKQCDTWVPSYYAIHDVLGAKVMEGKTKSQIEQIDIQILSKGLYLIKYQSDNKVMTLPFIKSE